MVVKYWVFKVKEEVGGLYRRSGTEIYNHQMTEGFWGLKEEAEKASQLEKGDRAIFYLVDPGKESCFLGTASLNSGFQRLEPEKAAKIIHKEYLDNDQGVFLTDINKWIPPLTVVSLRGKGPFGGGRAKFGPFFQGSVKLLKTEEEYETIIKEHELYAGLKKPRQRTKVGRGKQQKNKPY